MRILQIFDILQLHVNDDENYNTTGVINAYTVPCSIEHSLHDGLEAGIPFHALFRPTVALFFSPLFRPFSSALG
jgi:hypothetical protein